MIGLLAALHRRLEQVLKRYSRGEVPRIDWLDPLTFTALDHLRLEVLAACTNAAMAITACLLSQGSGLQKKCVPSNAW